MKQEKQINDIMAHFEKMREAAEHIAHRYLIGVQKAYCNGYADGVADVMKYLKEQTSS